MKKQLFFIAILLHSLIATICAQERIQLNDIEIINLGDGQLFGTTRTSERTPINGKVKIINGYSSEYIDAEFSSGYPIGKWNYYKNDKIYESTNYVNGYEDGDKITYYDDAKTVKIKTPLSKGKVNGTVVRYYSDGKKEYEKIFKDGTGEGLEKTYAEDGEIKSELFFKNGKEEGKSFSILNLGNHDCYKKSMSYMNGILEGEYKEEFCDGKPKISGKYITGKKDGIWLYTNKDGRKKPTEEYKSGELIRKISYYSNGKVDAEQGYNKGKEHGTTKQYTVDGELKSEKNYVNGKQVGKQYQIYTSSTYSYFENSNYSPEGLKDGQYTEMYLETKSIKTKGLYIKGQKSGKWITSNIKGTLIKEEDFVNNKLVGYKKTEKYEPYQEPTYTARTFYDANDNKIGEYLEVYNDSKSIRKKGKYTNGIQDGKWIENDKNGKLIREEIYENGMQKSSNKY
ncbi:MAG: hypothetical protein RL662_1829 [Bacteroidota bacterium]|jgi:antitoxin component YwqK of YwqJK toxin-antitoxin module